MTRMTTLSLITIAILGLNGCGGTDSKTTESSEDNISTSPINTSSIKKLSEASPKHKSSDWLEIEADVTRLDNTEGFNTMLLSSIDKNVAMLNTVGVDKEMAYAINSDAMYDELINLDIEELDTEVAIECKEDETCKEMAYDSLSASVLIDKEMAYAMAEDFRGDEKSLVNDKLVKDFTCEDNEIRTVQHYGLEDIFTNGTEPTNPDGHIASVPWIANYGIQPALVDYDDNRNDRIFADTVQNLPNGIAKGMFYIGLKSNGSSLQHNDTLSIGDYSVPTVKSTALQDLSNNNWQNQLVGSGNPSTDIYYNSFANIGVDSSNSSNKLLALANTNQRFDVVVQDDTSVDFITVATCSPKKPMEIIKPIVNNYKCEKGDLLKIVGGTIDGFDANADNPATPSATLQSLLPSPLADYDNSVNSYDRVFGDSLDLSNITGNIVSGQLTIGYKPTVSSMHYNDRMYVGEYNNSANRTDFDLYGNNAPSSIIIASTGERIIQEDLNTMQTNGNISLLSWMQSSSPDYFDIVEQDDTSIDFTQLSLCVVKPCGEDISIDLSQLANWTTKPINAVQNNVFNGTAHQGVWDNTLNWFDFENAHNDEVLKIDFCACGDTVANINHLKADNNATIKLDNTMVASQQGAGQTSMKRDDMGGNHVDGSHSIAGTGAKVNHTLRLDVHNQHQNTHFGVGVEGVLSFRGYLGKCRIVKPNTDIELDALASTKK
ncbi:MAG: hypothetical protein KAG56_01645 [Sulfurovaceae bacterium]|nr:hypothetical protein [Sulfurovaceae bacterium]